MIQTFFSNFSYTNISKFLFDGESFIYNENKSFFSYLLLFQLRYKILYRGKKKGPAMTQLPVTTYPQYTCTKALAVSDKMFLKILTKRNIKKKREHFRKLILFCFAPQAELP